MTQTVIAHISDLHIGGADHHAERASRVMRFLDGLDRIDTIVVSGDIADHGKAEEYEQARSILDSRHPVLVLPGNHDVRGEFRVGLLDAAGTDEPINQAHEVAGVQFVQCDSVIPGEDAGRLDETTLRWLDGVLGAGPAGQPAIVCLHHNPVPLHNETLDGMRLREGERLAEVLARHDRVVAVLCGHEHTASSTMIAGRPLLVAPGVASTSRLPWENAGIIDPAQPPGLAFHILDADRRVTTHFRVLT